MNNYDQALQQRRDARECRELSIQSPPVPFTHDRTWSSCLGGNHLVLLAQANSMFDGRENQAAAR
nr:hypothetical protein [Paracoccus saliphilus]